MYSPDIEKIVLDSCKELINESAFELQKLSKDHIVLASAACGIDISAGISPIGEEELNIRFFNPSEDITSRRYFPDTLLLHIYTRKEPRDVVDRCLQMETERDQSFDETIRIALKCFTAHTLKYRQDILNGDFTSWLPKPKS